MADTAAHLVDRVFPVVPVRQWVLSLSFALRYRIAYDASLTSDVLNVFIRALFGELRRRARERFGLRSSQCGAVTFVQRYGDALNCNPHFHCLCIDGVYAAGGDGRPEFHQLPPPEDEDVLRLTTRVSQRIESLLVRRGLGSDADSQQADPLSQDDPRNLRQADLLPIFGSRSRISDAVNGRRGISKAHARKLAEFFSVSPELFI